MKRQQAFEGKKRIYQRRQHSVDKPDFFVSLNLEFICIYGILSL